MSERARSGLQMNWNRIVNCSANSVIGEVRHKFVAAIDLNYKGMVGISLARVIIWNKHMLGIKERSINARVFSSLFDCALKSPKPVDQYSSLNCVKPRNIAEYFNCVSIDHSMTTKFSDDVGRLFILETNKTTVANGIQIFQRMCREAANFPESSTGFAIESRANRLGGVFNHSQAMTSRNLGNSIHVAHSTTEMNRHYRLCLFRYGAFNLIRINALRRQHIDENRCRT